MCNSSIIVKGNGEFKIGENTNLNTLFDMSILRQAYLVERGEMY